MKKFDEWSVRVYDLHRLRLLRELSLRGTLAAVAEALGYSPSAVSHQLAVLERETRAKLLEPVGRGVRLTAAAQVLVEHTEAILRQMEMAEAAVAASHADVSGTVRVAAFQTVAHGFVSRAMTSLASEYPALSVELSHVDAEAAIPGLVARDFDLALTERYPGEPPSSIVGVESSVLCVDQLHLATPPTWPASCVKDLADAPWIMEHPGTSVRTWATTQCRNAGFNPRTIAQSTDVFLHTKFVASGLAAAFLPGLALPNTEALKLVPLDEHRTIEISRRTGSAESPSINAVHTALRTHADDR